MNLFQSGTKMFFFAEKFPFSKSISIVKVLCIFICSESNIIYYLLTKSYYKFIVKTSDLEKKIPFYSCLVSPMTPKPCKKLRLRLISGHHLPKPSEAKNHRIRFDLLKIFLYYFN